MFGWNYPRKSSGVCVDRYAKGRQRDAGRPIGNTDTDISVGPNFRTQRVTTEMTGVGIEIRIGPGWLAADTEA